MTNRPHIGQVWRKDDNHDEHVVIIAVNNNWAKVIVCSWPDIVGHEINFSWLQANYTLDKDYK